MIKNHPFNLSVIGIMLIMTYLSLTLYAMNISQNGQGQFLLIPYYTVKNDLNTLVTITNNTAKSKAIRVHFREGNLGYSTLSFNAYLGPYDSWSFGLASTVSTLNGHHGEETTAILFDDESCTPYLNTGQEFLPYIYEALESHIFPAGFDNTGLNDLKRTQEGFIEILEMGELNPEIGFGLDVAEKNCEQILFNWSSGSTAAWLKNPETDILPASGGLSTTATVINVSGGTAYSYHAVAVDHFYPEDTVIHTEPGSLKPSILDADNNSLIIHNGLAINLHWENGVEAFSSLLVNNQVINNYDLDSNIGAHTDVVLSFPTRGYYLNDSSLQGPFSQTQITREYINGCRNIGHGSQPYFGYMRDRNGLENNVQTCGFGITEGCILIPPGIQPHPTFCATVNVISIVEGLKYTREIVDNPSLILGSTNNLYWPTPYAQGHFDLHFEDPIYQRYMKATDPTTGIAYVFHGLPVISMAFQNYINSQAQPGLLAHYGSSPIAIKTRKIIKVE